MLVSAAQYHRLPPASLYADSGPTKSSTREAWAPTVDFRQSWRQQPQWIAGHRCRYRINRTSGCANLSIWNQSINLLGWSALVTR